MQVIQKHPPLSDGAVEKHRHMPEHSRSGLSRLPQSTTAYLTLYQHADLGCQKRSTLILVILAFTSLRKNEEVR